MQKAPQHQAQANDSQLNAACMIQFQITVQNCINK